MLAKARREASIAMAYPAVILHLGIFVTFAVKYFNTELTGTEMWIEPRKSVIRIFMVQMEGGMAGESGKKIKSAFGKAVNEALSTARAPMPSPSGSAPSKNEPRP